jgi:hypothetical protein
VSSERRLRTERRKKGGGGERKGRRESEGREKEGGMERNKERGRRETEFNFLNMISLSPSHTSNQEYPLRCRGY